jgi:hypothetical protein
MIVLVAGLIAAVLIAVTPSLRGRAAFALGIVGIGVALAGPMAYALDTVSTPHSGAIPSAGPAVTTGFGGGPGGGGLPGGGVAGGLGGGTAGAQGGGTARPGGGTASGGIRASGPPSASRASGAGVSGSGGKGLPTGGIAGAQGRLGQGGTTGGGGFLNATTPGTKLVKLLEKDASGYKWVAATVNSNSAAGYQLATDDPVMAIGGFNGTDPAPTLAEFEAYVHEGKIHYFISSSNGLGSGGTGTDATKITQWVESHYTAETVDGTTVYNLSAS